MIWGRTCGRMEAEEFLLETLKQVSYYVEVVVDNPTDLIPVSAVVCIDNCWSCCPDRSVYTLKSLIILYTINEPIETTFPSMDISFTVLPFKFLRTFSKNSVSI